MNLESLEVRQLMSADPSPVHITSITPDAANGSHCVRIDYTESINADSEYAGTISVAATSSDGGTYSEVVGTHTTETPDAFYIYADAYAGHDWTFAMSPISVDGLRTGEGDTYGTVNPVVSEGAFWTSTEISNLVSTNGTTGIPGITPVPLDATASDNRTWDSSWWQIEGDSIGTWTDNLGAHDNGVSYDQVPGSPDSIKFAYPGTHSLRGGVADYDPLIGQMYKDSYDMVYSSSFTVPVEEATNLDAHQLDNSHINLVWNNSLSNFKNGVSYKIDRQDRSSPDDAWSSPVHIADAAGGDILALNSYCDSTTDEAHQYQYWVTPFALDVNSEPVYAGSISKVVTPEAIWSAKWASTGVGTIGGINSEKITATIDIGSEQNNWRSLTIQLLNDGDPLSSTHTFSVSVSDSNDIVLTKEDLTYNETLNFQYPTISTDKTLLFTAPSGGSMTFYWRHDLDYNIITHAPGLTRSTGHTDIHFDVFDADTYAEINPNNGLHIDLTQI